LPKMTLLTVLSGLRSNNLKGLGPTLTVNPMAKLLSSSPGIGPITATALAATVPDPTMFRSGREFAAWLGLTPKQNSTGGKDRLGRITKQGFLSQALAGHRST
jgi:transposase